MAEMSDYCAGYEAKRLREFSGWSEDVSSLRPAVQEVDGEEVETPRTAIADDDVLYVHDDYVVTDDVFRDEHVVFSAVSDEWKAFCHEKLGFEVPVYEIPEIPIEAPGETGHGAEPATP
ncbi:MAG TPA: hypothetical protein VHM02_16595 [Thermoanaerobaculia bacterium]|nr:hypothetical protein [Thermoanaerobaculia bacterium]